MKIKSMIAAIAASALTVSALAVSASAAITNANAEANYMYPVVAEEGNNLPEGCKLTDVYGIEAKLSATVSAEGETCVGAFCYQSDSNNWAQNEFCQKGGDKSVIIGDDGIVKWGSDSSLFAEGDTWAKVFVAEWSWADDKQIDFAVEYVKLLDKDGNELTAKAAETTTEATTTTADGTTTTAKTTTTKASDSKKADSAKTGDAGVGVAVAALGVAGAAAFVSRKKH
jgi:hypothetical protein